MTSELPLMEGAYLRDEEGEEEVGKLAVRLANSIVLPMALKSALELNLIEIISAAGEGTFLSPGEIAAQLPGVRNPEAPVMLDRVLRLLASYSILRCSLRTLENGEVERSYGAGPICKFLISRNHPDDDGDHQGRSSSFAPLFLLHHDKVLMHSWYQLKEAILEGGNPFERANGTTIFKHLGRDERFKRVFQEAMSNHTSLIMKKILDIYRGFEGLKVLVDVGGGIGDALAAIISKYHPHIKGINYELPLVLVDAPSYPGVEHVGGDMFESVPKGDAIFMKWILHAWKDGECVRILKNCFKALPENGKVIVVESILSAVPENSVSCHIPFEQDVLMLAQSPSGKERTQKEYEALAIKSGFSGCKVVCSAYNSRGLWSSTRPLLLPTNVRIYRVGVPV